jgi:hypothetical protein
MREHILQHALEIENRCGLVSACKRTRHYLFAIAVQTLIVYLVFNVEGAEHQKGRCARRERCVQVDPRRCDDMRHGALLLSSSM